MKREQSEGLTPKTKRIITIIVSAVIAIALGITCALCFGTDKRRSTVDVDDDAGVTRSAVTHNALQGSAIVDGVSNNTIKLGDSIEYPYNGGFYYVTLPRGTVRMDLWGAAGAGGAKGGHSAMTVVMKDPQEVSIVVGGAGSGRNGGWNGGGNGTASNGGGGGATHLFHVNRNLLLKNAYTGNAVIVAGGGGGGTNSVASRYYSSNGLVGQGTNSTYGGGAGWPSGYSNGSWASGGCNWLGTGAWGYSCTANDNSYGQRAGNGLVRLTFVSSSTAANNINAGPVPTVAGGQTIATTARRKATGMINVSATAIAKNPDGTAANVYFSNGTGNLDAYNSVKLYVNSACTIEASNYVTYAVTGRQSIRIDEVKRYPRAGVDGQTTNGVLTLYVKMSDDQGMGNTTRGLNVVPFKINVSENTPAKRSGVSLSSYNSHLPNTNVYVGNSNANALDAEFSPTNIYNPNGGNRFTAQVSRPLLLYSAGTNTDADVAVTIKAADFIGGTNTGVTSNYDKVVIALNDVSKINKNDATRIFKVIEYDDPASTHKQTAYNAGGTQIANAFDQITIVGLRTAAAYQVLPVTIYVVEKNTNRQLPSPVTVGFTVDVVFRVDNIRPVIKTTMPPVIELNALVDTPVKLDDYFKDPDNDKITSVSHKITGVIVPENEFVLLDKYGKVDASGAPYFNVVDPSALPSKSVLSDALSSGVMSNISTGFESWYISTAPTDYSYVKYSYSGATLTLTGQRATHSMYDPDRETYKAITSGSKEADIKSENCTATAQNAGDFYILIHFQDAYDTDDTGIWLPLGIRVKNAKPTDTSEERGQVGATSMPTAIGNIGATAYFSPMGVTVGLVTNAIGFRMEGGVVKNDLKPLAADSDNYYTTNMLGGSDLKLNELLTVYTANASGDIAAAVQSSVLQNSGAQYFSVATEPIYIDPDYIGGRFKLSDFTTAPLTIDGVTRNYVVVTGLKITLNNWTHNRYLYATASVKDQEGEFVNVKIAINVGNNTPEALDGTSDGSKVALINYENNGRKVSSSYNNATATLTYNIPMLSSVIITPYDILSDLNMQKQLSDLHKAYPEDGFTLNGLSGSLSGDVTTTGGTFTVGGTGGTNIIGLANSYNLVKNGGILNNGNRGVDYSTSGYAGDLKDTLRALNRSVTFSDSIAENNNFATTVPIATTCIDRLYFARESDASALDGFTFDPYNGVGNGNFAAPVVTNDSYIKLSWGNKIDFGGEDVFGLDFLVITGESRTPAGISSELTVTVRDRMGAGVSGVNSGVTQIKIVINVLNSTPHLKDPDAVYIVGTKAVEGTQVNPTVRELFATGENGILEDNEDGDEFISFYTAGYAPSVQDGNGNTADTAGNSYLGKYFTVSITPSKITITALSSTQNITSGLYLTFYATDGRSTARDDQSRLTVQVLVENSKPYVNNGANGIDTADMGFGEINMWSVTSFNDTDTTLTRFVASSAKVYDYILNGSVTSTAGGTNKSTKAASSDQVKYAVLDNDALQGSVLLPTYMNGAERVYFNVPEDKLTDYSIYKNYVPFAFNVAPSESSDDDKKAVAVLANFVDGKGNTLPNDLYFGKYIDEYDIIYFVDLGSGLQAYTASELRDSGSKVVENNHGKFFDAKGRFIVTDWAIYVKPKLAFEANAYFKMAVEVRDEAAYGGDTAGIDTAIGGNADSIDVSTGAGLVAVDGRQTIDCYMFVKGTGITTLDYYDRFDGYYTVSDGNGSGKNYISTYDGDSTTPYKDTVKAIYVDGSGKLVNTQPSGIADTDYTEIKTNVVGGAADATNAGTHSGTEYPDFDVDDLDKMPDKKPLEQAFRYSHTIEVSGEKDASGKYVATYLPMSYLALNKKLVNIGDGKNGTTEGAVIYPTDTYIAYDIATVGSNGYDRAALNNIWNAITIRDADNIWTGPTLNSNPYVTVSTFDYDGVSTADRDRAYTNSKYLNKALAVTTVGENDTALGYYKDGANRNNYVGNGHIMYLADQQNKLQEHLFGLTFTKNTRRSSVSGLTVSINVASCKASTSGSGTEINYLAADKDEFTETITLSLDIGNSKITLDTGNKVNGNDQYYVNMEFQTGDSSKSLALVRNGVTGSTADMTVFYSDSDYDNTATATGGDEGFFLSDSTLRLSKWSGGSAAYNRPKTLSNEGTNSNALFTNTSDDEAAQASMRRYYGANLASSYSGIGPSYHSNGGMYGTSDESGLIEGYSRYFSVGYADNGRRMVITPIAKTVITPDAIDGNVSDFYSARGLVMVEGDNGNIRAYYPLKVLVYDSCGDGTDSCSYVSLEIRVYITDSAPRLSTQFDPTDSSNKDDLNRTVKISLAVGSSYNLSLAEVISDNDLLSDSDDNWMWKSDYDKLNKSDPGEQFKRETGDYLMSPFDKAWKQTNNAELLGGYAKLYDYKNTPVSSQPDVIMYMEYDGSAIVAGKTDPSTNIITITANKRTINDGVAVKKFTFSLSFQDSSFTYVKNAITGNVEKVYNSTGVLTIEVTITNKAPTLLSSNESTVINSVTMRVSDSFTILTTPYDYFNGIHSNSATSASASSSYRTYTGTDANAVRSHDLFLNPKTNSFDGAYSQYTYSGLTSDKLYAGNELEEKNIRYIRNWTDFDAEKRSGPIHLGYSAIADDDTPWALRIKGFHYSSNYFKASGNDLIKEEGGSNWRAIDYTVTAVSACKNQPITVEVEDDEHRYVEYTFYVTVVSTPPRAITSADTSVHPLGTGMQFAADNASDRGSFATYMRATDGSKNIVKSVLLNNNRTVNAYSTLTVNVSGIAFDPDNNDNKSISLYTGTEVPLFSINDVALKPVNGTYSNDKFDIMPSADNKSFTIKCNYYDDKSNVDNLRFYVRDVGDDKYENAREINIAVTTLYSSLSNKHAVDNTTMITPDNYRVTGVDTVYVKSHDLYLGLGESAGKEGVGELSTYNFLKYGGMPETAVDQTSESGAYIVDPDVALNGDELNYDVRVYALMSKTAENQYSAMSLSGISGYFAVQRSADENANYFRLRTQNTPVNSQFSSDFLIGGRTAQGSSYNNYINTDLLQYVNNYFQFSIGAGGVSLELRPVTANIDNNILLYVEAEKKVGSVKVYPSDSVTSLNAGSLFYVKVKDSAPIANTNTNVLSFTGSTVKMVDGNIPEVAGVNTTTFKIFDENDPLASLFTDSDQGDDVSVDLFRTEADYRAALGEYYDICKAVGSSVDRALDITVTGKTLKIKINRMVKVEEGGRYKDSVTIPVKIVGKDIEGQRSADNTGKTEITLNITIKNSPVTLDIADLGERGLLRDVDSETHVGYSIAATDKPYIFDLEVRTSKAVGAQTVSVIRWLDDPDFTKVSSDTESFRLVSNNDSNAPLYLLDGELSVLDDDDPSKKIATIVPIFGADKMHFTGFTVTPLSDARGSTGTVYMRVIDRAGNEDLLDSGVTFNIKVTIANSAPVMKDVADGKNNIDVVGSDKNTLSPITIDIADYVTDPNPTDAPEMIGKTDTYVRFVSWVAELPDEIYSTATEGDFSRIFDVKVDEHYQKITVTPLRGFYGTQKLTLTIADGDFSDDETDMKTFTLNVSVRFDFADISELNSINATRGMVETVSVDTLVKPLTNHVPDENAARGIALAAEGDADTFNPAAGYVVTNLAVPNSYSRYIDIIRPDADNPNWRFRPKRVTDSNSVIGMEVEFKLESEADDATARSYKKNFNVTIAENPKPKLIEIFKNGYTFYSSGDDRFNLNAEGTVLLSPSAMFSDNLGDTVKFESASSAAPSLVTVEVLANDTLSLRFLASGTAEISVTVSDTTDESVTYTFKVSNHDLPPPTFWQSLKISFETNKLMWILIAAGVVLAIIILIIVIIAVKHRKRKREELEAMLMSEMELEEQMMRLAAGPGMTQYNSYGYLPPTVGVQHDPNMLLGSGGGAPGAGAPDPNVLNLNPGQASSNPNQANGGDTDPSPDDNF